MFEAVYAFHQRRQHKRLGQSGCPTIVPAGMLGDGLNSKRGKRHCLVAMQCRGQDGGRQGHVRMESAWTGDLAESKGPLQLLRIEKGGYGPFGRHIVDHRPARTAIPPSQLECDACGGVLRSPPPRSERGSEGNEERLRQLNRACADHNYRASRRRNMFIFQLGEATVLQC